MSNHASSPALSIDFLIVFSLSTSWRFCFIGDDGEEVTDDAEASADSSQTDESQEEESNDN